MGIGRTEEKGVVSRSMFIQTSILFYLLRVKFEVIEGCAHDAKFSKSAHVLTDFAILIQIIVPALTSGVRVGRIIDVGAALCLVHTDSVTALTGVGRAQTGVSVDGPL